MSGCGDSSTHVRLPTQEALAAFSRHASALAADTVPPATMTPLAAEKWRARRRAILDAGLNTTVGRLDGAGVVLGGSLDVGLTSEGKFYVLDRHDARILLFDPKGNLVESFGRHGDGPYDFRNPQAVAVSEDWLGVAQAGGVKLFRRLPDAHEFHSLLRGRSPRSLCFSGDRRLWGGAMDQQSATYVREYRLDIEESGSVSMGRHHVFGGSVSTDRALARGRVACATDKLLYAFEFLPWVEGYAASEEPLWSAAIGEFEQGWFVESGGGRRLTFPRVPDEYLVAVAGDGIGYAIATYHARQLGPTWRRRAYLIDVSTGEGALLEEGQFGIIVDIDAHSFARVAYDPYPTVELWRTAGRE